MRTYDINFKQEAIKLAKEIGSTKAVKELSMAEHICTSLVIKSFAMIIGNDPVHGAFCHSDRGSQCTSHEFREYTQAAGFLQRMSFAGSSCYGNAKCESMWNRMKEEALYGCHKTERMGIEAVKSLVFCYYMDIGITVDLSCNRRNVAGRQTRDVLPCTAISSIKKQQLSGIENPVGFQPPVLLISVWALNPNRCIM